MGIFGIVVVKMMSEAEEHQSLEYFLFVSALGIFGGVVCVAEQHPGFGVGDKTSDPKT